ncbi:MAG: deoxyribonuclease V [Gammaproteobacteria bacterium]
MHRWDVSPKEAVAIQRQWCAKVVRRDCLGPVRRVAGIDVGFKERGTVARAAVVILRYPELALLEQVVIERPAEFPYVPGLLSFREVPVVLEALARLDRGPDLLLCDAQGYAHPRRFGLASHLGVITDTPSIGVAKTRLIGEHAPVPARMGAWTPLRDRDEIIGAALRTRTGVKPLYVSVGHRVCLETALRFVMSCVTKYRLPETTRLAHRIASGP